MTEKVKVTPKMDELIRNTLKKYERHKIVEKYNSIACDYKNEIDLDTLIKALYIGYEVEPEFKVGDWVVSELSGDVWKVDQVKQIDINGEKSIRIIADAIVNYPESLRHATPEEIAEEKERRWWKKHGRDVWELKERDILISKIVKHPEFVTRVNDGYDVHFSGGNYETWATLKRDYEIVCFAENRLDVKTND